MSLELRKHYNDKYKEGGEYHGLYGNYDKDGNGIAAHYRLSALYIDSVLQGEVNSSILEIGCGTGAFLHEMKNLGYENMVGIDISDQAKELSITPEITFQGDAAKINFEDKSFDLIVSIGLYEHIPAIDLNFSLKEIIRVGKKAVLWIDQDKGNSDHCFNEDETWWANRIVKVTNTTSICVDKKMAGGSGTHPILINFDLGKVLVERKVVVIKKEEENHGR